MILHFSHMGLTEGRTFTDFLPERGRYSTVRSQRGRTGATSQISKGSGPSADAVLSPLDVPLETAQMIGGFAYP